MTQPTREELEERLTRAERDAAYWREQAEDRSEIIADLRAQIATYKRILVHREELREAVK